MDISEKSGIQSITEKKANLIHWGPFLVESKAQFHVQQKFDNSGKLVEETTSDYKYTFTWEDNLLTQEYHYHGQGDLQEKILYHHDGQGFCFEKEIIGQDGQTTRKIDRKSEKEGLIVIEREGSWLKASQRDRQGNLIKELIYTGENPDRIIHYKYDDKNRLIQKDQKEANGNLRNREILQYGTGGELAVKRWEDGKGNSLRELHYSYPHGENKLWLLCQVSTPHPIFKGRKKNLYRIYREFNFYPGDQPPQSQVPQGESDDESPESRADNGPVVEEKKFSNGTYRGPMEGTKMEGLGEFLFDNGSRYKGDFRDNKMEGSGEMHFADGRIYKGHFKAGKMDGHGRCLWPNGDRYTGAFTEGEMHGVGEFIWADGTLFRGLFEHNRPSDQGMIEPGGK